MRRRVCSPAILAALVVLSLAASCQPQGLTTKGQKLWTAQQIAQRVEELQAATIQANVTGAVADSPAILIVKFTVSAQKTLQATPAGWQQMVVTGWTELKKALPPGVMTNPAIAAAVGAVDTILGAAILGGPNG